MPIESGGSRDVNESRFRFNAIPPTTNGLDGKVGSILSQGISPPKLLNGDVLLTSISGIAKNKVLQRGRAVIQKMSEF